MITAFLLLPVMGVLTWLYWYLLPQGRRWRRFDSLLFLALILMAIFFVHVVRRVEWSGGGPLWPDLVSAVGAYVILAGGLAAGLAWRRRNAAGRRTDR